jgi:hypothetical protein
MNIAEFLRITLANGPVPVKDLQARARAAELLGQDQPISQCRSFRSIADKLGVKRFQAGRRWFWTLPSANQMPGATGQVSDTPTAAVETPDSTSAASEISASGASPSSDTIVDRNGAPRMTKEEFMKASIENYRALAREAYAEAKVRVARYLETGDLADLFPEMP